MSKENKGERRGENPGFILCRDEFGIKGYTRLHDKGTLTPRAAIASLLILCAKARRLGEPYRSYDHKHYMWKIGQIKKNGTWL